MPEIPVRLTLMLESNEEADVADMWNADPRYVDSSFDRPASREPGTGALSRAPLLVADTRDRITHKDSDVLAINPDPPAIEGRGVGDPRTRAACRRQIPGRA